MFPELARNTLFTFSFSPASPIEASKPDTIKPSLKRSTLHPDAPTPNPSPQHKRTLPARDIKTVPLILPISTPDKTTQPPPSVPVDVFDTPIIDDDDSVETCQSHERKLTDFFQKETVAERHERYKREAEKSADTRELRLAAAAQAKEMDLAKKRELGRLRGKAFRDRQKEKKLAEGRVPYENRLKKRVCIC